MKEDNQWREEHGLEPILHEPDMCQRCGKSHREHTFKTDCRLFIGPSSDVGAEAERSRILKFIEDEQANYEAWALAAIENKGNMALEYSIRANALSELLWKLRGGESVS